MPAARSSRSACADVPAGPPRRFPVSAASLLDGCSSEGGDGGAVISHQKGWGRAPVSYTHLTLPTICSV
eukprot:13126441-Alexandrium_andersonii.AAC.1